MGRFGSVLVSMSAMLMILAGSFAVRAQESVTGVIHSMSFQSMPEGLPILVRPLDDSPENLTIKTQLEQALAKAGYSIAKTASFLVLSFETRRELGGGPTPRRPVTRTFVERHEDSLMADKRYNPQIGKGSPVGPSAISASRFRLDATLDDKQSGKRLWRGWAIAPMQRDDTANLTKAMAPVMAESLGETVREQPFEIPVSQSSEPQVR